MNKKLKTILILSGLIFIFIAIRSIHFYDHFAFFYDQSLFSTKALEIWHNKSLILIGPPTSFNFQGRYIFQGSIIYYFQLFFLLLGNFNPLNASYFFMLFCALMIIPLYYGVKLLFDEKAAICLSIIYTLLPFYIASTVSMWNPNFQFSLLPVLILFMGLYKKYQRSELFLAIFIMLGFLLQFHYQFVLIILGFLIYYFLIKKNQVSYLLFSLLGLIIGFSPIIYFEIKHDFYNTRTVILLLSHLNTILNGTSSFQMYYLLSISFFMILIIIGIIYKKLSNTLLLVFFIILLCYSIIKTILMPIDSKGRPLNWKYADDLKVSQIVEGNSIQNYNIFSFYDAKSTTQKYFLKKDNVKINYDDYKTNDYLYVIYMDTSYFMNPAYEVNTFQPSIVINKWKINNYYNLYLLKRSK